MDIKLDLLPVVFEFFDAAQFFKQAARALFLNLTLNFAGVAYLWPGNHRNEIFVKRSLINRLRLFKLVQL